LPTYEYPDLPTAQNAIREIGRQIVQGGPAGCVEPAGDRHRRLRQRFGAQAILDLLPTRQLSPAELLKLAEQEDLDRNVIYKVVFKEEDTVAPVRKAASFDLPNFQHPERYRSQFEQYLPYLTVLVNCIYWIPVIPAC
jgi:alpha-aminoadipic semialdehyde synthase